jgi:hypothetical protein
VQLREEIELHPWQTLDERQEAQGLVRRFEQLMHGTKPA